MKIDYTIKYSNRKTLNITIDRNNKIHLTAPKGMPASDINAVVEKKKLWIFNKLKTKTKYPLDTKSKETVSGESLMYLGHKYKLILSNDIIEGVIFSNKFTVSILNKSEAQELLYNWYLSQAKKLFQEKVELYSITLGVNPVKVVIRNLKYSWGSCSPNKTITLNWKLIRAPIYVINYIIVHELAHLIELNHSAEFWNIVGVQVPEYNKAKRWLKENGGMLEEEL
ncbi:MAG: M48 family metallopeptidase [Ignavibacteriaceae bacterium]|nr:M48 family metallopeptidase [Ignavibacteriaceae bacterium]